MFDQLGSLAAIAGAFLVFFPYWKSSDKKLRNDIVEFAKLENDDDIKGSSFVSSLIQQSKMNRYGFLCVVIGFIFQTAESIPSHFSIMSMNIPSYLPSAILGVVFIAISIRYSRIGKKILHLKKKSSSEPIGR